MAEALDPKKLVAELVGTFTFVFVGAGSIIVTGGQNLVGIALAHGLAFGLMITALGHISGGLFNPALTVGLWVTQRLDAISTVGYILAQLAGGILGAIVLVMLFPEPLREAQSLGTPVLNPGIDFMHGVGIEIVLTFFLMLAVFGNAIDLRGATVPSIGGLGIGLIITMDIFAGGPLTGASMNPARTLGPALVSGTWDDHLVYWIGPIVGAVLAALLYHYVFLDGKVEPLGAEA